MMKAMTVFTDGGSRGNPGPAAVGWVIKGDNETLVEKGKFIGRATNNIAEYTAVIEALKWLIFSSWSRLNRDQLAPSIIFFLDSKLVVNQLNGFYKIKNDKLKLLVMEVRGLENKIERKIIYRFVPREKNREADRLVNEALDRELL